MNFTVRIIRAAFREIQKLPHEYFQDVAEILRNMAEGNLGDCRKLEGYKNLRRTKRRDVRVIWEKVERTNDVLIIKAGPRKEVYEGIFEDRARETPLTIAHILKINQDQLEDIPTYRWDNSQIKSWYEFVYGGYLYSPVITNEQQEIFVELQTESFNGVSDFAKINSLLIQSAPGTGKTVCAALMACELHHCNWNIIFILPEALNDEVKNFTNIKSILKHNPENFFIGTFAEWLFQSAPDIYQQMATPLEELQALQEACPRNRDFPKFQDIGYRELILYKSFVIQSHTFNELKHPIYTENELLINKLKKIDRARWTARLEDKINWIDGVSIITRKANSLEKTSKTLFIFDEAQDYFIDELRSVTCMLERWQVENNHTSVLCLLGDMNQRIQPINFDWGQLQLNKIKSLKYNYRNTKYILKFANIFHSFAQKANSGKRKLPDINSHENTFENGEPVRLLECDSDEEALKILATLSKKVKILSILDQRSLLRLLSNRVKVIYTNIPENYKSFPGIDYLNIKQAKGREFDACVAFCVFKGDGLPSFEEANNWYTIFTRPRYRLLIIATTSEVERVGRTYFDECQSFKSNNLDVLDWITDWANGEHLIRDIEVLCNAIYEGLRNDPIQIYWDMYAALRLAQIEKQTITEIENNAIQLLQNQPTKIIYQELLEAQSIPNLSDRIPLKCLLLRALGSFWQAIEEATELRDIDFQEYQNLILRIADELENKGFIYEAARTRSKIGIEIPEHFPFSREIPDESGSLISLLCKAAINRIYYK